MWATYHNYRTITTLEAIMRLTLQIRRCFNPACPQVRKPYRPEAEGRLALPKHEFGLDERSGFDMRSPKTGQRLKAALDSLVLPAGITQRVLLAVMSRTWRAIWFSCRSTESVSDAD
jgi:hypothetical protein